MRKGRWSLNSWLSRSLSPLISDSVGLVCNSIILAGFFFLLLWMSCLFPMWMLFQVPAYSLLHHPVSFSIIIIVHVTIQNHLSLFSPTLCLSISLSLWFFFCFCSCFCSVLCCTIREAQHCIHYFCYLQRCIDDNRWMIHIELVEWSFHVWLTNLKQCLRGKIRTITGWSRPKSVREHEGQNSGVLSRFRLGWPGIIKECE